MAQTRQVLQEVITRQSFRVLGLFAPGLAAVWALRIWNSTRRYRESEHDARWRAQATLQMLDHAYGRIAVYRWGEADRPLVLCLHGWNGRASQFATMLPALLKAGYQVLAFDAPGHGKSSGHSCNIFQFASVLQEIAATAGSIQAVIASSYGGMVAAYAIKHLELPAQKLVMIASPISTHYLLDKLAESLGMSRRVMQHLEEKIRHEFGEDVFERMSAEQNLKNAELPILLIHDKQDHAVSWRNSERIVAVARNATPIYTEGHGHRRLLRDKKLIRKLVSFIRTGVPGL
jgi:pimeloyl-ACP methyl ester carboxylesterase